VTEDLYGVARLNAQCLQECGAGRAASQIRSKDRAKIARFDWLTGAVVKTTSCLLQCGDITAELAQAP
jgi:hypothetical protein